MSLEIKVSEKDVGVIAVTLVGSIDTQTCSELEKRLDDILAGSPNAVMFDMHGVTYITSLGLSHAVHIKHQKRLRQPEKQCL